MRAGLRLGYGLLVAALAFAAASARAQDSAPPTSNTPATDAIGPRELQNFSLDGTVTRPADPQPTARTPAQASPRASAQQASRAPASTVRAPAESAAQTVPAETERREAARQAPEPIHQTVPASTVTVALPKLQDDLPRGGGASTAPASGPGFSADSEPTTGTLAPERRLPFLPWLLAAVVLGAGAAFMLWRNRSREAFAGGPRVDAFSTPGPVPPAPAPRPAPAPPKREPSSIPGLVSTRLRPWVDLAFQPLRCSVDDHQVIVEFELELFNSGSAPARAVLVEASLFNAGPNQDAEIGRFFDHPVGEGDRITSIPPLKRVVLRPRVVLAREHVRIFEVAGRKVFVPLIGFNALYRWSGGEGQSSTSYLIGRDTKGEKMAPFRLDLGPRVFRGLGARLLPTSVRK